jgi:hypothetical protein
MLLSEIFPESSIKSKFKNDVRITKRDRSKLGEISKLKKGCMVEIGGGAWDQYVRANPNCNPQTLSEYFQRQDPKLYLAMERHTGLKVLHDIFYTVAEVEDPLLEEKLAAELLVAVTYPNVLRISDVTFCDPYNKIPDTELKYKFQHYKGLNLFAELMGNCEKFCNANNLKEISLAAAYVDLVPFFKKYGFEIDDTPAGRMAIQVGEGIPMSKPVNF